jgi:solute:Na+ symporter, SSS family
MSNLHLTTPDYLVIGGYFLIVLWVGFYFRKMLVGAKDYFAGAHQVPWWLAGISHYMSSFSAFSFIAYAQLGYRYGWVSITLFWASVPACILGGSIFAQRWRRARIITPIQFLESRFSPFVRQLFAWAGIPVKIFDDALKLFATGIFLALSVGISLPVAIGFCGVVMVAYTYLGGLWALVVTDFVQFLMKILAMLLLLPLTLWAFGSWKAVFHGYPEHFFRPSGGPYGWIYIIGFLVLIAISYNSTWALAQKYYSVRTERDASKAAYTAAALNFLGAPLMILPAILGRRLLPDLIAQNRTADTYVLLVLKFLPVGMVGIIVAAMFSATMATVSADFNAIASVLTQDVYHRLINPLAKERTLVSIGRFNTLILGVLTVGLSLWIAFSHQQSLFHLMVTVFGLFIAPTFLPLLAGLTIRKITWKGAIAGFAAGLLAGIFTLALKMWYLPHISGISAEWTNYTFEGISILLNTAVTILAMWAGSVWLPSSSEERARIEDFFRNLGRPITSEDVPEKRTISPGPAIAWSTIGVAVLLIVAGIWSDLAVARSIDLVVGAILGVVGIVMQRKYKAAGSD